MAGRQQHSARRRLTVVAVIAAAVVTAHPGRAIAAKAPQADDLVQKLLEEDVCEESARPIEVSKHEVTCRTDLHGGTTVHVHAWRSPRRMQNALASQVDDMCAARVERADATGDETVRLAVGSNWYATATPSRAKAVARVLSGQVKSFKCS